MNILHLYKDYYPVLGGIENHIKILAEAQAAAGHEVTVLVCNPGFKTCHKTLNEVKIIKAGRLTTQASMPISLSQPLILARLHPDIVHIQSPYPLGEAANWLIGRARATVISYQSDIVKQKTLLRFYGPILRQVLRAADGIITNNPRYLESSPWLHPVRPKCRVIPIGINLNRFNPGPRTSSGPLKLLFVGRLRYYKGLDTLLHALTQLPQVHLTIVGIGPMQAQWQALSQELGLSSRVNFAGEIDETHLPDYYHQADVFVLPSNARSEAYGIVLLEAMAAGLPCVTTELGTGTSWIVQDEVTGFVVPPQNPGALAQAIAMLEANNTLRRRMGQAGQVRVQAEFSQEIMVSRIMQFYQELLT
ncbi:MAG: glycosyl transferase family 1 [Anaerolineae bacterium]|nr:glycosyltransferase [Anaerolineales bacterium]MCQ3971873.1 glycosyl transferase family 1 [Anaerolineae bacterium]